MRASADYPYPPLDLVNRVLSLEGADDPLAAYEVLGAETKTGLVDLLPHDWSFQGKRVLDFGCGAGRTLRHFVAEAETAEVWGADIDARSIEWLQQNLSPPLRAMHCEPEPPLRLEPGSFDLIWAISVFTHLADSSLAWLRDLHRLLKPGGLLIATYMGRWNSELITGEPWDEDTIGMNVLRDDEDWDSGGPIVLMSDWWVRAHWSRAFEILELIPNIHGQTWTLLRKRDVDLTAEELEAPADDPREYLALHHNVRQVLQAREQVVAEARRDYEASASWQVTRPLRALARAARSLRRSRSAALGRIDRARTATRDRIRPLRDR
jgi:SAM-dependent methyltransferase